MSSLFRFKKFDVDQTDAAHPVGTDGILLGAWAPTDPGDRQVLDIGTGTGLAALLLAQRLEGTVARLDAVELQEQSAAQARRNFAASPWREQLCLIPGDIRDYAESSLRTYDLIVSNPPFFSEITRSPDPARRMGRHTGSLSMHSLAESVLKILAPEGRFCLILPPKEAKQWCMLAVPLGLYCTLECEVFSRSEKPVERLLLQMERRPHRFSRDRLLIYTSEMNYSEEWKRLTSEFL